MHKIFFISFLLLTACSIQANPAPQVTPTVTAPPFATATLAPTFTPRPSTTPAPPTIAPTIAPIPAMLTNQINVRTAPDIKATSLGLLNYGSKVQVIGKDTSGTWWQIIYPENSLTTGWVASAYVQVSEDDAKKIPVIRPAASIAPTQPTTPNELPLTPGATVIPTSSAHQGTVKNQIYVRVGPGSSFDTLGLLDPNTVVTVTGRNQNNVWLQINYESGPNGFGWVAAAYITGADLNGLPYFDNQGNLLINGTPVANPGQPTLTATAYSPAAADGDSEQNPAVRLKFSPEGSREFTFSSELSSPNGDTTDWVAFTPYDPANQSTFIYFKLECSGNGGVTAMLEKDGIAVPELKPLVCGNYDMAVQVLGGKEYILVLNADGSGGPLRYARYTLIIKSER